MAESDKKYRQKLGATYNKITQKSYQKHRVKRLAAIRRRAKERMKTDPAFKLKEKYRKRVYDVIRGRCKKASTTQELVGCTFEELKTYLESKFQEGMSWENYGKGGWEVDHIKPCASFNFIDIEQQKICFHYTNLQPMWRKDNASKGSLFNNKRYKHADHIDPKQP